MPGNGNVEILQFNVYLVNLDPTIGHEIKKTRPCLIISPNEMNKNIGTVIIAPMTTKSHKYPTRVPLTFQKKKGRIVLDQIRTIDNKRILRQIGKINEKTIKEVKDIIKEMLVE